MRDRHNFPQRYGDPRYKLRPKEIKRDTVRRLFGLWISGQSYAEICETTGLNASRLRHILVCYLKSLWNAHYKWKMAEARCCALAMELRLLRLGKEAAPDQPLESLNPPPFWYDALKRAEIDTVNQLRAVDAETLLSRPRFPIGAIDWSIMKLDKLGLSHALKRPEKIYRPRRLSKRSEN